MEIEKSPTDGTQPTARVTLEINLRPALPIEAMAKLQRRADDEGVTLEAIIIRGILGFLELQPQAQAAA